MDGCWCPLANYNGIWRAFNALLGKADCAVLANLLVPRAGIECSLALVSYASCKARAGSSKVAESLPEADTAFASLSIAAVTLTVTAKVGNAPLVGASLAGKTLDPPPTSVKGLLLAVAKGVAELAILALTVGATEESNGALLARAVNVTGFAKRTLGIDLASEVVATTAAAFRVTDLAILALSAVAAFVVLLGLA